MAEKRDGQNRYVRGANCRFDSAIGLPVNQWAVARAYLFPLEVGLFGEGMISTIVARRRCRGPQPPVSGAAPVMLSRVSR
jgi:hypothetical protein